MNFPYIKHIDDVRPFIKDIESFSEWDKKDYIVIDYTHMDGETFRGEPDQLSVMMRKECRGVIFDKDGFIIRRSMEKFFNVNETQYTMQDEIDWSRKHLVMDKLDGSMVSPLYLDKGFRLGTRAGITGHSIWAESYMVSRRDIQYREFMDYYESLNLTPCFEFFSNDNMIVLDYGDPFMDLLCARDKNTGVYVPYEKLVEDAAKYNVPVVKQVEVDLTNPNSFLEMAKAEKEAEGYVIRFEGQESVKVKGDWYVTLHHLVSGLNQERNIVRALIDNNLDDILPMLPVKRQKSIGEFAKKFWDFYAEFKGNIYSMWDEVQSCMNEDSPRKDWAIKIQEFDSQYQSVLFKFIDMKDDNDRTEFIKQFIHKKANKEKSFAEFIEWTGINL